MEQNAAAATNSVAFPSNVKAGSLLVAIANTDATPSVSDTRGNTWNLLKTYSLGQNINTYWAVSNGAGASTVSFPAGGT